MRTLVALALAFASTAAGAAPRPKIAVTEIRSVQGVAAGTATILSDIVVSEVARAGYDVISQADITAMIGFERQKQVLGCSDDSSCLAEIGGALGVDFMVAGQVGQIGTRYRISLLLVDSKKAKVVARSAQFCDQNEDALARAAEGTVRELLASAGGSPAQVAATSPAAGASAGASTQAAPGTDPSKVAAAKDAPDGVGAAKATPRADLSVRGAPAIPEGRVARTAAHPMRRAAWWTIGGGAALLAGGVVFGLQASSKRKELQDAWASPSYPSLYDQKSREARNAAFVADVLYGAGATATGVGVWMLVRSRHQPIAIAPVLGDQVGVVAAASF